mgnify:CR=1 FL=1
MICLRQLLKIAQVTTKLDWSFGTAETGDVVYSGEGFLSSVEMSAEMESPVSYSGSITVTGAIAKATNV